MTDPMHVHRLDGCAPTPLAAYLKALGVLRLLVTAANRVTGVAADPAARGWWADERFHLRTRLDRDSLLHFFLEDYAPSPIIAPWNGRAGFLEGEAGSESSRTGAMLMRAIEASSAKRMAEVRETIGALRREPMLVRYDQLRAGAKLAAEEEKKAPTASAKVAAGEKKRSLLKAAEAAKTVLLPSLRANADPRHLAYIDACFVLAEDERAAPLLGSGGNDGSRDFGVNFAEALLALLDFETGTPTPRATAEIGSALFGLNQLLATRGAIGQFGPGQGGANASTGYEGWNALNQWDIVLALEGALVSSGALTRRWGVYDAGRAAFPFTFEPSGAGAGGLSTEDPNIPRGEIWIPLWSKPSTLHEVEALFAEGRLTLGRAMARSGLDAARAVARLGVSRGIAGFERYSLLQPDSKMPYQATPLGRFRTPDRPRRDLIADLDAGNWLMRLRRTGRRNAPARARQAVRRLEDALFDMTRPEREADGAQAALIALGGVVSWLASSREGRETIPPPPLLSPHWIRAADDGSAELRVAAALASLGWPVRRRGPHVMPDEEAADAALEDGGSEAMESAEAEAPPPDAALAGRRDREAGRQRTDLPMAAHFAPVQEDSLARSWRQWAGDDAPTVVWGAGGLIANMVAVLERRLVEAAMRGLDDKPLAAAAPAQLADLAAFLEPGFDDARCAALLAGLVWARPCVLSWRRQEDGAPVPFAYAALKPLFMAQASLRQLRPEVGEMPVPPGLVARLRRGDADGAVREALARARASRLASPFDPARARAGSTLFGAGIGAERLAATLLIPLRDPDLKRLMDRAYPHVALTEETDDAA